VEKNNKQEMKTDSPQINLTGSNIRSSFAPFMVWRSLSAQWIFHSNATRTAVGTNKLECQSCPRPVFLKHRLLPSRSGLSKLSSFFEATRWTTVDTRKRGHRRYGLLSESGSTRQLIVVVMPSRGMSPRSEPGNQFT